MERKSRAVSKPSAAELPKDPRERATIVDINQDPRYCATNAPDLSKLEEREYKREQLERERARYERHELSMRLLGETLDRRVRNNSPPHERSNGANDESNDSQPQRTETNVQRTSTGPRAKTRPPEPMAADITLRELAACRRSWEDLVELEQLDRLPARQQRAMLRTSLSIEMRATLQLGIGIDNDDDITVTAILDRIQEHVRGKRNTRQDRTRRTQARGRRAIRPILHCLARDCQQRRSLPALHRRSSYHANYVGNS